MTVGELKKLKGKLPPDGLKTIAKNLPISYETVRKVFAGENKKSQTIVIDEAIRIIEASKEVDKKLISKINAL